MIPRPFLDIGFGEKDIETSQQSSEGKVVVGESKGSSMVHELECSNKIRKICSSGDVVHELDPQDHERPAAPNNNKAFPGWLSNQVPIRDNNVDDQASESMIKKARVSVRARSESSMVSTVYNNKTI